MYFTSPLEWDFTKILKSDMLLERTAIQKENWSVSCWVFLHISYIKCKPHDFWLWPLLTFFRHTPKIPKLKKFFSGYLDILKKDLVKKNKHSAPCLYHSELFFTHSFLTLYLHTHTWKTCLQPMKAINGCTVKLHCRETPLSHVNFYWVWNHKLSHYVSFTC